MEIETRKLLDAFTFEYVDIGRYRDLRDAQVMLAKAFRRAGYGPLLPNSEFTELKKWELKEKYPRLQGKPQEET